MNKIADGLRKIRERLTPEGAWTQLAFARTDRGNHLPGYMVDAGCCWCLAGAALRERVIAYDAEGLDEIDNMFGQSAAKFNDAPGRTQAEVLAKLGERIAFYSARGGE